MLTANELSAYHTGFEFGDLFGKGRMRELIYNFKLQLLKDQEEIEQWKTMAMAQAVVIPKMYEKITRPEENLLEENIALQKELGRALEMQQSLQEYAEDLERKLNKLKEETNIVTLKKEHVS